MQIKFPLTGSDVQRSFSIFSISDRRKIAIIALAQSALGIIDLLGVAIIGVIGALAVTGIRSGELSVELVRVNKLLGIEELSFQVQTAILAILALIILITRTLFSMLLTRKTIFFISRRSAKISGDLTSRFLAFDSISVRKKSIQDSIYSLTTGVEAVTLGVVGTFVMIVSEFSLLLIMFFGLLAIDAIAAIGSFLLFSITAAGLIYFMRIQAFNLGKKNTELFIKSNEKIYEALKAYREIIAKNRRVFYSNEITNARFELSSVIAELRLMPSVSKYVFEITTLIGMVGISAIQFLLVDATKATATIAIFLAAGTRIAPSILRLQQYFIQINANTGIAKLTLDFIETLPIKPSKKLIPEFNDTHSDFDARVEVRQLSFAYPGASLPSLLNINLAISKGTKCAIVGPSGSGKTTLVDILLGAIETNSGDVCVSGMTPLEAINRFPGAIGYVPQEVEVFRASIRTNVALGFPKDEATDERVMRALKIAQLNDFIESLPNGLETMIGENGFMISVGQKQRLGIARAMFTSPKLIFLDESTSSLDALTELSVTQALSEIPFDVTLVVIAHRLSTIREFDQIIYLKGGEILAQGSFQEVRELVPDFETQVRLMGIVD